MSDQPPQRDAQASDEPFGRPLPTGGLAESMPDWLRRPPAWRDASADRRSLPPPDTSPIDPRTLIDVGDLPPWLQRLADRTEERRPQPMVKPEHRVRKNALVVDPHRVLSATPPGARPRPESSNEARPKVHERHDPPAVEANRTASLAAEEPVPTSQVVKDQGRRRSCLLTAWIPLVLLAITGIVLYVFWL